ncbi:hypothetical protein PV327_011187 [Microctonus hyperodae]|uniref:Uncharacterized protein n=1 Tax=Microctonus hyperodae TaxID=165561 RepID=A0AA39FKX4_MICHY|nr:hypothetical protein PV327_011187 [Microctonus hyperodae]
MVDNNYQNLIDVIYNEFEYYADGYGHYNEFVSTKNNIAAYLIIDNLRKLYWLKRIWIEDDQRPETVNYYPRLAPMHLEEQCTDTDEVSTDPDEVSTDTEHEYIDHEMNELFLQNWIAAYGNVSGYITYEEDDEDDDDDDMMI